MSKMCVVLLCVALPVGSAAAPNTALSATVLRELVVSEVDDGGLSNLVTSGRVRPTGLAAGDFDSDGVPDLVCGYTGADGSFLTLYRGNVDSIFPHGASARQRHLQGTFTDSPFLTPPRIFEVVPRPDFLDVGDFDLDGKRDIVVGTRDGRAYQVLTGDGTGVLRVAAGVALPASTADLVSTGTGSQYGLADLVRVDGLGLDPEPVAILRMRLNPDALEDLVVLQEGRMPLVVLSSPAATITVDTVADSALAGDGFCSFREAIGNANANADTTTGDCAGGIDVDAIEFDIGGGGSPISIGLDSALPAMDDPVTINGNSQACASPPCVELRGEMAGPGTDGLTITAGTSTVRGLVIRDFGGDGISLGSSGNFVEGNFIGTAPSGAVAADNLNGILVTGDDNSIGGTAPEAGNLISGNAKAGIRIEGVAATENRVQGNFIGTDVSGTVALGNNNHGVLVDEAHGNLIGGAVPGAGNLISGNDDFGVLLIHGANSNEVQGNLIGPDITISAALNSDGTGVNIQNSPNNTVGGPPGAGNVISGNYDGVYILGPQSIGNQVIGNRIGTDPTGTAALGNLVGVDIILGSSNVVGGTTPEARNVISGNEFVGVRIGVSAEDNQVLGNFIGTDASGTVALGNGTYGVHVIDASNNAIGGPSEGARNIISANGSHGVFLWWADIPTHSNQVLNNFIGTDVTGTVSLGNARSGVRITDATFNTISRNLISSNALEGVGIEGAGNGGNAILGNSISDNGLLGIDLNASDGVTVNDTGDTDAGPNGLQNYPSLTSAVANPAEVTIQGSLNSQAGTSFRLEFFASASCDASGHGEGERYLGYTMLLADSTGSASFDLVLSEPVDDGDSIVTTATDPVGSTSEFSGCAAATCTHLAALDQTILAQDVNTWVWSIAEDVKFAIGDLAAVATYATTMDGTIFDVTSLDMSMDFPATGGGLFYLVRPLGCGSWQTTLGAETERDSALP